MAHARAKKAVKQMARRRDEQAHRASELHAQVVEVRRCFPGVARQCGIDGSGVIADGVKRGVMTPELAAKYIRLCFEFKAFKGGANFAIKPARLRTFCATLAGVAQRHGLIRLFYLCARFKAYSPRHVVSLCISHEFDSTKQDMALEQIQRLGRPSRRRIGCEVMFQHCVLHIVLHSGDEECIFSERWLMSPLVMLGKTAAFVAKCVELRKAIDFTDTDAVKAVKTAVDSVVEQIRCDKGTPNLPAIRHFASILEENVDNGIYESTNCEVHVTNRLKNAAKGVPSIVGKLFSLSNLLKFGSTLDAMIDHVEKIVGQEMRRVEAPPPVDGATQWHDVFDEVFKLSAEYHKRRGSSRTPDAASELVSDVSALLEVLNDSPTAMVWNHYCWNSATRQPCCQDLQDAQEKMTVRLVNVFVTPAFPRVTMSRFTYVLKALGRVLAGIVTKRIFPRCFNRGFDSGTPAAQGDAPDIAEFGAGDTDLSELQGRRAKTVGAWLNSRSTTWEVAISFVTTSVLSELEYAIMPDKGAKAPVLVSTLLDRFTSPIAVCLTAFVRLLQQWHFRRDGPWRLLGLMGFTSSSQHMRRWARSQVLSQAAGVGFHHDDKYSALPWAMHKLINTQWSREEQDNIVEQMLEASDCCLPIACRHFRKIFATKEKMLSTAGLATLKAWAAGHVFHTLSSERGHAQERSALAAAAAPGRSFHHHSRSDLLRQLAVVHQNNNGLDPTKPMAKANSLAGAKKAIVNQDHFAQIMPVPTDMPAEGAIVEWRSVCEAPLAQIEDAVARRALPDRAEQQRDGGGAVQPHGQCQPQGQQQCLAVAGAVRCGTGGNVKMTFVNERLRAKKAALGRKMKGHEVAAERARAHEAFDGLPAEQREAWRVRYQAQVRRRQLGEAARGDDQAREVVKYTPHLGLGNCEFPITPKAFCSHYTAHNGMPEDGEVYKPRDGFIVRQGDVCDHLRGIRANKTRACVWIQTFASCVCWGGSIQGALPQLSNC